MIPIAATRLALTVLAAVHLIVTIWHGEFRRELAVALSPGQSFFIYIFFVVAPLLAVGLVWARRVRQALWLFLAAVGASLLFGIYYRYILLSPENIHRLPSGVGAAHARFAVSAAIRALIGLGSALATAFILGRQHARHSTSCARDVRASGSMPS
jgi:hypothetical protein